jgi:RNA methyltransferase, TrmH family
VPAQEPKKQAIAKRDPVERVYGLSAALAAFASRPDHIVNIAYSPAARRALGPTLREAARLRIAYREVSDEELGRMSGSSHHEGVCMLVRRAKTLSFPELSARATPHGLIVVLDQVGNPHNAGAILRTAAFFGARGLVVGGGARDSLSPAALRVAEGGAEHVPIMHSEDITAALKGLRAHGMTVVGADSSSKQTTAELDWPARCVLVLGHEREGLSPAARKQCDVRVRIEGTGAIDSLNVSVAAGVLIAGYAAVHGVR